MSLCETIRFPSPTTDVYVFVPITFPILLNLLLPLGPHWLTEYFITRKTRIPNPRYTLLANNHTFEVVQQLNDPRLTINGFNARFLFINCKPNFPDYTEENKFENAKLCQENTARGALENVTTYLLFHTSTHDMFSGTIWPNYVVFLL